MEYGVEKRDRTIPENRSIWVVGDPSWFSEMLPLSFDLAMEIQKFRRFVGGQNRLCSYGR